MSVDPVQEQVRLYAKQLKLPTFTRYPDILRKARPDTRFAELLLELMKEETEQRQKNQNRKRLRTAGFPYTKTLEELDLSRYDGNLSDLFLGELASCKLHQTGRIEMLDFLILYKMLFTPSSSITDKITDTIRTAK